MNPDIFAERRERLRARLAERGLAALLVSHDANRYYLSGFELHDTQCDETAGWLLVRAQGGDILLTDPRYEEAAKARMGSDGVFIYTGRRYEQIGPMLKDRVGGALGYESKALSAFERDKLAEYLELTPQDGHVEALRVIKDADEIARMRASCALNHRVLAEVEAWVEPGMTEARVAWEIERRFREGGATELAFPSIVAVGANAALPHAIPAETTLRDNELLLVDTGCRLDGYCSDQTRTWWIGDAPSARYATMLERVLEAHDAAAAALRPGLACAEAYRIARAVFDKYGVAERFNHSLGHGVGLQTHEAPSLSPMSGATLRPGMVVTVEPGLYYPEWGGARWEHMAVITPDGCELL